MDYQFKTDIYGQPLAVFSMGHEALGHWLSDELKGRETSIKQVIQAIENIQAKQTWDFELRGVEYDLLLSPTEASIRSHALSADSIEVNGDFSEDDDPDEQELDYYDAEAAALCGLDDFKSVMLDWVEFTSR